MRKVAAIVLAAGKGARIKYSVTNKVLLPLAGKPMLGYSTQLLKVLNISPIIIVVGFKKEEVMKYLGEDFDYVDQEKLLGTGHAVKKAISNLPNSTQDVLVLHGDHAAFFTQSMIKRLIKHHRESQAAMTFISVQKRDPTGYGRVLRGENEKLLGIREEKNATKKEKVITEINTGTYCFRKDFLEVYLAKIKKDPVKDEYYLTELVELALKDNLSVATVKVNDEAVALGVNTREELLEAERMMKQRIVT